MKPVTPNPKIDTAWFKARLKELGKHQKDIAEEVNLERSVVTKIIGGNIKFHLSKVDGFAKVLESSTEEVLRRAGVDLRRGSLDPTRVAVVGAVQAGEWMEAVEWPEGQQYSVSAPEDDRYPAIRRFALEVRGPSMNEFYPDGSIIICIQLGDIARSPKSGERVICQRWDSHGLVEATVKEYVEDGGKAWLVPRSTHPDYRQSYLLPYLPTEVGYHIHPFEDAPPRIVRADQIDGDAIDDFHITALVIGSYRKE